MTRTRVVRPRPAWLGELAEGVAHASYDDFGRFGAAPDGVARAASVLVLFRTGDTGPEVLLLERASGMNQHAGQVAFPGGARDPEDADAVATALREAHEETDLDPACVEVVATLQTLWLPPSGFNVTPVVGWWHTPCPIRAVDPRETSAVDVIPVAALVDPGNRVTIRHPSGFLGPAFLVRGLVVWGFTAAVMAMILGWTGWDRSWDQTRIIELDDALGSRRRP